MKKTPGTFLSMQLGNSVLVFAVFLLVLVTVFVVGFQFSRHKWEQALDDRLHSVIGEQLQTLALKEKGLSGESVNRTVRNTLDPGAFAVVFDAAGRLVFWRAEGKGWYREDTPDEIDANDAGEADVLDLLPQDLRTRDLSLLLETIDRRGALSRLVSDGVPLGAFDVGHQDFAFDPENLQLLVSLVWALFFAAAGAVLISLLVAGKAFRHSSSQVRQVQSGLRSLADGNRAIAFPPFDFRELDDIAESALELQAVLGREKDLRRRWAEDIAHDLRTPLAGLRVQLDGLADGVLDLTPERLNVLKEELSRLETLALDLLALGRLESPELQLVPQRVSLPELEAGLRSLFVPQAQSQGRDWDWGPPLAGGAITADVDLLHRALTNLFSNALLHAKGPGPLKARWTFSDEGLRVVISNPGNLSSEQIPFLFDRLRRGESARSGPGHGLGLAIAQTIAELHGGSLCLVNLGSDRVEARLELPVTPHLKGS